MFWNIEGKYVWKEGQPAEGKTAWYSDVQIQELGDPTKESQLNLKLKVNLTNGFSGCLVQVSIFVWSRNNPDKKYKFVEVYMTCLNGSFFSKEFEVKVPLINDEEYNKGL